MIRNGVLPAWCQTACAAKAYPFLRAAAGSGKAMPRRLRTGDKGWFSGATSALNRVASPACGRKAYPFLRIEG